MLKALPPGSESADAFRALRGGVAPPSIAGHRGATGDGYPGITDSPLLSDDDSVYDTATFPDVEDRVDDLDDADPVFDRNRPSRNYDHAAGHGDHTYHQAASRDLVGGPDANYDVASSALRADRPAESNYDIASSKHHADRPAESDYDIASSAGPPAPRPAPPARNGDIRQ